MDDDGFAGMVRPLRHYADFSGRSRRSELLMFYLLTMIMSAVAHWGDTALFDVSVGVAPRPWFSVAVDAALLIPTLALAVRRLHDTGRSGWWLLIGLPVSVLNLWEMWRRFADPFALPVQARLPTLVMVPLGFTVLAILVLLLWTDDEETNRYGPNPRYGEAETAR